jgi:hypothetical protein
MSYTCQVCNSGETEKFGSDYACHNCGAMGAQDPPPVTKASTKATAKKDEDVSVDG